MPGIYAEYFEKFVQDNFDDIFDEVVRSNLVDMTDTSALNDELLVALTKQSDYLSVAKDIVVAANQVTFLNGANVLEQLKTWGWRENEEIKLLLDNLFDRFLKE